MYAVGCTCTSLSGGSSTSRLSSCWCSTMRRCGQVWILGRETPLLPSGSNRAPHVILPHLSPTPQSYKGTRCGVIKSPHISTPPTLPSRAQLQRDPQTVLDRVITHQSPHISTHPTLPWPCVQLQRDPQPVLDRFISRLTFPHTPHFLGPVYSSRGTPSLCWTGSSICLIPPHLPHFPPVRSSRGIPSLCWTGSSSSWDRTLA